MRVIGRQAAAVRRLPASKTGRPRAARRRYSLRDAPLTLPRRLLGSLVPSQRESASELLLLLAVLLLLAASDSRAAPVRCRQAARRCRDIGDIWCLQVTLETGVALQQQSRVGGGWMERDGKCRAASTAVLAPPPACCARRAAACRVAAVPPAASVCSASHCDSMPGAAASCYCGRHGFTVALLLHLMIRGVHPTR